MTSTERSEDQAAAQRHVVVGGLWRVTSAVLPMVSALALSVLISRVLGPAALGLQSLVAYIQALVLNAAVLSLTQAGIQMLSAARGAHDDQALYWLRRWSLQAHAVVGVGISAVMLALGAVREDPFLLWVVIAVTGLIDALAYGLTVRVAALEGWRAVSTRRLVSQFLGPALGMAAVLLGGGITEVFIGQAIGSTYLLLALLRVQRRLPPAPASAARIAWRPVARLWLSFVLTLLLAQIVQRRVELLFLEAFATARDVAMYAAAFTLVSVAVTASVAITGAAMPAIATAYAAHQHERLSEVLGSAVRVLLVVSVVLVAGFLALSPATVLMLFGPDFLPSSELVRWLSLSLLLAPLAGMLSAFWLGIGVLRPVVVSSAVGAVLDIALCLALVPGFGAAGAVGANLAAQAAYAVLLLISSRDHLGVALRRPVWLLNTVVTAAAAAAAALVPAALLPTWAGVPLGALAFALVICLLGPVIGLMHPRDRVWLASVLPRKMGFVVSRLSR